MIKLLEVNSEKDILPEYRNTPIGKLIEYHNLGRPFDSYSNAELLIGMCMDNRKHLHIPDNFSFIIRTGGANMRNSEFKVSFAIAIAGVKHIALIGHSQCGMVNLHDRKAQFIKGLTENAGWVKEQAEEHFMHFSPKFEVVDAQAFILSEAKRLRLRYPKIMIAPMFYLVEDNRLYFLKES